MLDYCVSTEDNRSVVVCPNQKIADDQRLDQLDGMGVLGRVTLTITQPLYTFGKITHGKAAARAGVEAYEAGLERAAQSADLLAVETFYGLQLGAQVKKVLRKATRKFNTFKKRVEKSLKVEGGQYTSNDLRRLVIQEAELKARSFEVDALIRQAEQGVRLSCEVDAEKKIKLESSRLKALDHPLETQEALWEHARAHRLDLKMAQAQVLARQALLSKATADMLPDLGLVGALTYSKGTSAEDNPDPFANDPFNVFGYGVYLGLNWSLGAAELMSSREEAHAALDKALAQLKGAEQLARLSLIEAHEQAKRRQAELTTRKGAMRAAKKWMNSTFMNLNMGIVKSSQAAQSLSAYLQASVAYDQATYEYNLALTRLWRAAGVDLSTRLR
jgi:outer membrane protein TolC